MLTALRSELRWRAKKLARVGMALGSWASGSLLMRGRMASSPRVRVLMYHRFRDAPRDPFSVRPDEFEKQMRWLAERRLAVSADELGAFIAGRRSLPDGSVVVSVDDGFRDFLTDALPIMRKHGIPGICFVPVAEIADAAGLNGHGAEARLTWDDLEALSSAGIAIGSHSYEHRSLGRMSQSDAFEQARMSRSELERRLGRPIVTFAYPFGTRADYNDGTRVALHDAGYAQAFVTQHGAVVRGCDPLTIPRVKVEGGEALWMFRLIVRGGLDGWSAIDRTMWRLQQGGDRHVGTDC